MYSVRKLSPGETVHVNQINSMVKKKIIAPNDPTWAVVDRDGKVVLADDGMPEMYSNEQAAKNVADLYTTYR